MRLVLLVLATLVVQHMPRADCKPNVVVVMSDDLAPHYKELNAKTPNLDSFAKTSVEFSKALAVEHSLRAVPLEQKNGVFNFRDQPKIGFRAAQTMPGYFKGRGYKTYGVGRVWHTDHLPAWAAKRYDDAKDLWDTSPRSQIPDVSGQECQRPGIGNEGGGGCVYGSDNRIIDTQIVTKAVSLITGHNDSFPFFLFVGLRKPHAPFESAQEDMDAYDDTPIPLPSQHCFSKGDAPGEFPNVAYSSDLLMSRNTKNSRTLGYATANCVKDGGEYFLWEKRKYTPIGWVAYRESLLATRKLYLASVTYMDRQFGRMLKALKESGHEDNTIVVFTSDNGFNLGEYGQWEKKSNYENANRVPLMIRVPRARAAGRRVHGFVELVDLFPTLATLAGIGKDARALNHDGKDLSRLFTKRKASTPKSHALYAYPACNVHSFNQRRTDSCNMKAPEQYKFISYSVRTKKHRYTLWLTWDRSIMKGVGGLMNWADRNTFADVLVDHSDSGESTNLNQDRAYAKARRKLVQILLDEFEIPELDPPDASGNLPAPHDTVNLDTCDKICEQTPRALSLTFSVSKCKRGCRRRSCNSRGKSRLINQQSCAYGKMIYGASLDELAFSYRSVRICINVSPSAVVTKLCKGGASAEVTITEAMCRTVCEQTKNIMTSKFEKGKCEQGCGPEATCVYTGKRRWKFTTSCNYGKSLIGKKPGQLVVQYMSVKICVRLVEGQPKAIRC